MLHLMELFVTPLLWHKHGMRQMFIWNLRSVLWAAHTVAFIPALTVKRWWNWNTIQLPQPHTLTYRHQAICQRKSAPAWWNIWGVLENIYRTRFSLFIIKVGKKQINKQCYFSHYIVFYSSHSTVDIRLKLLKHNAENLSLIIPA